MLLRGRADKDGWLPLRLVFLLSTFFIHNLLSLLQLAYDVAGTKFTVCVRVCSGYRGRRCVYRCFSGCWGRPGWDFHFWVDFNDQMSPTGKMLDHLSSHVSQLLVWELIRKVESASRGRQAQSQKVRGQRHGAQPTFTTVWCVTLLFICRLKCLESSKIHTTLFSKASWD